MALFGKKKKNGSTQTSKLNDHAVLVDDRTKPSTTGCDAAIADVFLDSDCKSFTAGYLGTAVSPLCEKISS